MAAYVVFDVEIRDAGRYQDFMRQVKPALEAAGAKYLARGGAHKVYEGDWSPRRMVILEFPSVAAWEAFYNGPVYQGLKAIRDECSSARLVGVEGLEAQEDARVVRQPIDVPAEVVYAFVRQMEKLPLWASGLARGIEQRNGAWFADSPMGEVQVAMAPVNPFGVLDHDVTLPDGTTVHNALRVTPRGNGSLLSFVVLRAPGASQENFDADVAHVRADLLALKQLLEQQQKP